MTLCPLQNPSRINRTYAALTVARSFKWEFPKKLDALLAQANSLCYKRAACVSPNQVRSMAGRAIKIC